jgi:hypothetical protein
MSTTVLPPIRPCATTQPALAESTPLLRCCAGSGVRSCLHIYDAPRTEKSGKNGSVHLETKPMDRLSFNLSNHPITLLVERKVNKHITPSVCLLRYLNNLLVAQLLFEIEPDCLIATSSVSSSYTRDLDLFYIFSNSLRVRATVLVAFSQCNSNLTIFSSSSSFNLLD